MLIMSMRSAIILLTLLVISCTEKKTTTETSTKSSDSSAASAAPTSEDEPTFTRDTRVERDCSDPLTPDDPTYGFNERFSTIRDLVTDRRYDVELCASGLLILRSSGTIVDTISTEGSSPLHPDHELEIVHERIVANHAHVRSSAGYGWALFIAVVDGRLTRLGGLQLFQRGELERKVYQVDYSVDRKTLDLVVIERFLQERAHRERPNDPLDRGAVVRLDTLDRWEETRRLHLDKAHWIYHDEHISLDGVPTKEGAVISGTYPGVVLRGREPQVFVKGRWFAIEKSDDAVAYIGSMKRRYSGGDHETILSARE